MAFLIVVDSTHKLYVPDFDMSTDVPIGWLEQSARQVAERKADGRFQDKNDQ